MRQIRNSMRLPPLVADRVRTIGSDGFAFIPNRFLHDGFFAALNSDELLLYLLLVLAGNRHGVNYYHYDTLCELLRWAPERYLAIRNCLIEKDLIAFDGTRIQVLELPPHPPTARCLQTTDQLEEHDAATIREIIESSMSLDTTQADHVERET